MITSQTVSKEALSTTSFFIFFFFFFSSRRRHTRCSRDWSSDVCSSDLATTTTGPQAARPAIVVAFAVDQPRPERSEERRVGKECRARWSPCQVKNTREVELGEVRQDESMTHDARDVSIAYSTVTTLGDM